MSFLFFVVYLRWPYLDKKAAPFVGDFQHFRPGKTINPQLVFINHETTGADTQHDIHPVEILGDGHSVRTYPCICDIENTEPSSNISTWFLFGYFTGNQIISF